MSGIGTYIVRDDNDIALSTLFYLSTIEGKYSNKIVIVTVIIKTRLKRPVTGVAVQPSHFIF